MNGQFKPPKAWRFMRLAVFLVLFLGAGRVLAQLNALGSISGNLCPADSTTCIGVSGELGQEPYTYYWKLNGVVVSTDSALCAPIAGRNYYGFVVDNLGAVDSVKVLVDTVFKVVVDSAVAPPCYGCPQGTVYLHYKGGQQPYKLAIYRINPALSPPNNTVLVYERTDIDTAMFAVDSIATTHLTVSYDSLETGFLIAYSLGLSPGDYVAIAGHSSTICPDTSYGVGVGGGGGGAIAGLSFTIPAAPKPPHFAMTVAESANEGMGLSSYPLTIYPPSDVAGFPPVVYPVSVDINVSGGVYGTDYTTSPSMSSGTLHLVFPNSNSKTITITVIGDDYKESDKELTFSFSNASDGYATDEDAVFTILNDDIPFVQFISGGTLSVPEGNSGYVLYPFKVLATGGKGGYPISVPVNITSNGTYYTFHKTRDFKTSPAAPSGSCQLYFNNPRTVNFSIYVYGDTTKNEGTEYVHAVLQPSTSGDYNLGPNKIVHMNIVEESSGRYGAALPTEEDEEAVDVLSLYPNPSNGQVFLSFFTQTNGDVKISITNLNGQEALTQFFESSPGLNRISLDGGNLIPGVYNIQVITPDQAFNARWIRQ